MRGSGPGDLENVAAQSVFAAHRADTGPAWRPACSRTMAARPRPWPCSTRRPTRRWDGAKASLPSPPTSAASRARRSIRTSAPSSSNNRTRQLVGTAGVKLLQGSGDGEALLGLAQDERLQGVAATTCSTVERGDDRLHAGTGGDVLIGGARRRPVHLRRGGAQRPGDARRDPRLLAAPGRPDRPAAASTAISTGPATSRSSSSAATASPTPAR